METIKVSVLGVEGVGKSAILHQFINSSFLEEWEPTMLDARGTKREYNSVPVTWRINDTGHLDLETHLFPRLINRAHCVMLVFSVVSKQSWEVIPDVIARINKVSPGRTVPIMLAANFCDEIEGNPQARKVTKKEMKMLADSIPFCDMVEVTARSRTDCENLFQRIFLLCQHAKHLAREDDDDDDDDDDEEELAGSSKKKKKKAKKKKKNKKKKAKKKLGSGIRKADESSFERRERSATAARRLSRFYPGRQVDPIIALDSWPAIRRTFIGKKKVITISSMPYFLDEEDGNEDPAAKEADEQELNRKGKIWASATLFSSVYAARRYTNGTVLVGHVLAKKADRIEYPCKLVDWCFVAPNLVSYHENGALVIYDCQERELYLKRFAPSFPTSGPWASSASPKKKDPIERILLLEDRLIFISLDYICSVSLRAIKRIPLSESQESDEEAETIHNSKEDIFVLEKDFRLAAINFLTTFKKEFLEKEMEKRKFLIASKQSFRVYDILDKKLLLEGGTSTDEVERILAIECFHDTIVATTSRRRICIWVLDGRQQQQPIIIQEHNLIFGIHMDFISVVAGDMYGNLRRINRVNPNRVQRKKKGKKRKKDKEKEKENERGTAERDGDQEKRPPEEKLAQWEEKMRKIALIASAKAVLMEGGDEKALGELIERRKSSLESSQQKRWWESEDEDDEGIKKKKMKEEERARIKKMKEKERLRQFLCNLGEGVTEEVFPKLEAAEVLSLADLYDLSFEDLRMLGIPYGDCCYLISCRPSDADIKPGEDAEEDKAIDAVERKITELFASRSAAGLEGSIRRKDGSPVVDDVEVDEKMKDIFGSMSRILTRTQGQMDKTKGKEKEREKEAEKAEGKGKEKGQQGTEKGNDEGPPLTPRRLEEERRNHQLHLQWCSSSSRALNRGVLSNLENRVSHVTRFFKYIICGHQDGRVVIWDKLSESGEDEGAVPAMQINCKGAIRRLKVNKNSTCIITHVLKKKGCAEVVMWAPKFDFGNGSIMNAVEKGKKQMNKLKDKLKQDLEKKKDAEAEEGEAAVDGAPPSSPTKKPKKPKKKKLKGGSTVQLLDGEKEKEKEKEKEREKEKEKEKEKEQESDDDTEDTEGGSLRSSDSDWRKVREKRRQMREAAERAREAERKGKFSFSMTSLRSSKGGSTPNSPKEGEGSGVVSPRKSVWHSLTLGVTEKKPKPSLPQNSLRGYSFHTVEFGEEAF